MKAVQGLLENVSDMDCTLEKKIEAKSLSSPACKELDKSHKIYDAVHGFIRFNELERMLIDSEPFQRLHHIHQLGIAFIVYPGATHTRFEHSLGTMELASRIFERITSKWFDLLDAPYWSQIVRLAALCHDLGHLPFSHDAEKELLGASGHELWTKKVIESAYLLPVFEKARTLFPGKDVITDVLKMAIGEAKLLEMGEQIPFSSVESVLSQVVTGDFFGADRIDYLLRDAKCTGVSYGLFDYHQMIEMLCVLPFQDKLHLGIEENGVESCEALLLARHFMHQRVYQYSSVRAHKFHLCRFMLSFFKDKEDLKTLSGYLSFSDSEILTSLRSAAKDPRAAGHVDAEALIKKEKRFKAVSIKEGIGEFEIKKLQKALNIPKEALFFESPSHKTTLKGLHFPVRTRLGSIIDAEQYSRISITTSSPCWVYISPEHEKKFREAARQWE